MVFIQLLPNGNGLSLGSALLVAGLVTALILTLVGIVYWRRRDTRRGLIRRIAELETLAEAGRAIVASELDLMALCELIANEAGKVIDNSTFQIGLFEHNLYHILFWRVRGEQRPTPQTFDLRDSLGLVGWVRDHGRPLLIKDFQQELSQLPARPHYISANPSRSAIFLPLLSGEEVMGVMAAHHPDPYRFREADVRRLSILANQAAAGISNARLFEQVRARADDLEMVSRIARRVNAIQDMDEIFRQVVVLTRERLGFHPVNVVSLDPESGRLIMRASSVEGLESSSMYLTLGEGLTGTAAATRQTVVAHDVSLDERYIAGIGVTDYDIAGTRTRAEIAIPLMVDEEVLGVLDVQSDKTGGFSQREQAVLEALANEVSAAIYKARQLATQREQAWVATVEFQTADAISRARDPEDLTQIVARLTSLLAGARQCAILIWEGERHHYRLAALHGATSAQTTTWLDRRLELDQWTPLTAVHVGQVEWATQLPPPWAGSRRSRSMRLFPLMAQGVIQGVMVVEEGGEAEASPLQEGGATRRRQRELLQRMADQTGQAIANARLRLAQQEEAWVNTALLQVAEAVNSLIELNEILGTIVRLAPMLVGARCGLILIWDTERQTFRAGPSYGVSEMGLGLIDSFAFDATEFAFTQTYDHYALTPGTVAYRITLPTWLSRVFEADAADALPLHARGQLVGALLVADPHHVEPLSGRRLRILAGIAQQAAIAVVNDQLYQESAERDRLEQELSVAYEIQAKLIPGDSPHISGCDVAGFWQAARQVSGDFYDFLPLSNDRWGIIIADVADKGIPAALFMALCRTVLRVVAFNRLDPALVLERANELILNDTASDLFVTVFYAIWDPEENAFTYANGGHNPPLVIREDGQSRLLTEHGLALGILEGATYRAHTVTLRPGDVVLFYTDGVTEALNEAQAEFGLDRLRLIASQARQQDAHSIMRAVQRAVEAHAGDTLQYDDSTMVIFKYIGRPEPAAEPT